MYFQKIAKKLTVALAAFSLLSCASISKPKGEAFRTVEPGTIEDTSNPKLKEILALDAKLNHKDDEFVVYYVRPDGNYADWALWIWAIPGGDGNAMWQYSQNWTVVDGIGYMKFKLDGSTSGGCKPVSSEGKVGLIVRKKDSWVKDCSDDRIFDTSICKKAVIYSQDQSTYTGKPYEPKFTSARLSALNKVELTFSGRFALDLEPGSSNFEISDNRGNTYKICDVINSETEDHGYNFAKKATVTLETPVSITDVLSINHPLFESKCQIDSTDLAIKLSEEKLPSADLKLGATYVNKSVTVNIWAPTSSEAKLNLYKKASSKNPDYTVPMIFNPDNGVWTGTFAQVDPDGMFYDITLKNSKGIRTVLDPYAKSMAAYKNDGSVGRGAIVDMNSPKAGGRMSEDYVTLENREDAVIYEISVRDFTISPDSGVKSPKGTYSAFIEKIPYLKSLGITHVQLMPVLNFYYGDETDRRYENTGTTNGNNYNWGYDPHNYFTPEGWFSTNAEDPYKRIAELKNLINECHKFKIGVIIDVVYNHMAGIQFLDDIVPGYYFRRNAKGSLTSNSGCGNDTATERAMMKRLVVDSVEHWVKEYKVDGFRFDLMGLMESSCVLDAYKVAKSYNPCELFEGEGWKMYNGPKDTVGMDQNYMKFTDDVAVFNDEFRDAIKAGGMNETGKGFITKVCNNQNKLFRNLLARPMVNYVADAPRDSLQYLTCHDGLTLHDAIAHNVKLDESVPEQKAQIIARIKMGNFLVLTSQGIPFLHGGQERGRSKPNLNNSKNETIGQFVRNSYDSGDNINQFVWKIDSDYEQLLEYTKSLIALRKNVSAFRMTDARAIAEKTKLLTNDEDDWLMFAYSIKADDGTYYVCVNGMDTPASVKGKFAGAKVLADSMKASADGIEAPVGVTVTSEEIKLDPLTAAVIKAE